MPFKHSVLSSFLCLCFSAPASSKFNPKWQKYSPNLCIQGHFDLWRCSSNWLRQPIVSRFACCFVLFFVCLFVSTWRRIVNCSLIGSLIYRIFNLFLDRGNCLRIDGSERWANLIGDNRVNLLLIFICSFFDICVRVSFMNGFSWAIQEICSSSVAIPAWTAHKRHYRKQASAFRQLHSTLQCHCVFVD